MAFLRTFYFRQAVFAAAHAVCVLLGLAPFEIWPLSFAATFFVFQAAHEQTDVSLRKVLVSGCLFALALTTITFVWIIATIHRYTGEGVLLTAALSLVYALLFQTKPLLFFILYRLIFRRREMGAITGLAVAAALALSDAIAPELFVWSWGNTLTGEPHLRQAAALGSVYLVSFIACLGGWTAFRFSTLLRGQTISARGHLLLPEVVSLIIFFVLGLVLRHGYTGVETAPPVNALIVQTNIGAAPEAKRGDAAFATDAINRLFNQSAEGMLAHSRAQLIIWPEASMPFHAAEKTAANAPIYSSSLDGVLEYLSRATGAAVIYQNMSYRGTELFSEMTARPAAEAGYLKRRLVPWGEYLPLEKNWRTLRKIFPDAGNFHAGEEGLEFTVRLANEGRAVSPAQLAADSPLFGDAAAVDKRYPPAERPRRLSIKPLLCYEALFPSDGRTREADLIVNLSSDAWFGDGIEGHQHAGAAALRAVENGIPLVRAAMSGVSYVVDNRGDQIGHATGQARSETLYVEIPLTKRKTLFARFGIAVFYLVMFCFIWPYAAQRFRFFGIRENK